MTYASYLLIFLGGPLLILTALLAHEKQRERTRLPWIALAAHVLVAVVYTTPWDNYLVETGVWWYDPARVIGLTLGWVPIEEYTFFVLQTLMTGMWLIWLMPRLHTETDAERWRWRSWRPGLLATTILGIAWLASVAILWLGWQPGAYLALELGWFLPPIALQVIVGGDMLWQQRRLVMAALLPAILYLIISDALAIQQGVWTISPQHTLGVLLGGVLPLEEIVFFTLTNVLIVFGMTLVMVIGRRLLHERQAALRC